MMAWLDGFQRRHPAVGFLVAVIYKYVDDQGGYLAALITYYAFVSLFPALLLLTTVLGVVLVGHPELQQQVVHSAVAQFPVIGDQLGRPQGLSGGPIGVTIGIVVAVYGGLGVGQAVQNGMDTLWAVPRNERPDPLRSRLRSLLLLLLLGGGLVATTALSAVAHASQSFGVLGTVATVVAAVALNSGVCLVAFRVATARAVSYRQIAPGAVAAAIVWQLLQWFGAVYVSHVVKSASATNGVFALVLGLLAFLYLIATALLLCATANVVAADRLHPRALLTPFTDDVELTGGDRRTYTGQAKAQRAKSFQRIEVAFDGPTGHDAESSDGQPPLVEPAPEGSKGS
ncbi:YihY/virulence factor BrkB family protein [Mycolicibacterium sp. 050158]|uniref:YihY/virulence factor BrkB family protein n=1 Tax=Mycolicibacterium sp. 050158 TaxID=3090602 RepID=UPI00299EA783|nr:YihY/virulence factor BrkB family protein [Mycolicibacterium sp. 050158]MDX1888969.1 YihY/virulence factor BrkB family protein [Mycolicibacterium sp. 050158]